MQGTTGRSARGHGRGSRCRRGTGGRSSTYSRFATHSTGGSGNHLAHGSTATHGRCGHQAGGACCSGSQKGHTSLRSFGHGASRSGASAFAGRRRSSSCPSRMQRSNKSRCCGFSWNRWSRGSLGSRSKGFHRCSYNQSSSTFHRTWGSSTTHKGPRPTESLYSKGFTSATWRGSRTFRCCSCSSSSTRSTTRHNGTTFGLGASTRARSSTCTARSFYSWRAATGFHRSDGGPRGSSTHNGSGGTGA